MIAIQTNERLDLIDMTPSEFLESVAKDGFNSSVIHAKIALSINRNEWLHLASSVVGEIKACFRQVEDRFEIDMNPVNSINDLEFYISPEGEQYSCESAYLLQNKSAVLEKQDKNQKSKMEDTKVEESKTANEISPSTAEAEVEQEGEIAADITDDSDDLVAEEGIEETVDNQATSEQDSMESEEKDTQATSEQTSTESEEKNTQTIIIDELQKRASASLDNILRSLTNLSNVSNYGLEGVRNYIGEQQDSFRNYAEQYLQNTGLFRADREKLKTDFKVTIALGETQDLIDSLLVFPIYTHIISKKDLLSRFSSSDLLNSVFIRVCPIGIMNGQIQSYVEENIITSSDIMAAEAIVKAKLKEEKKSKRKLSAKEMYDYMEEALEQVYQRKAGPMSAENQSVLIEDLKGYLDGFDKMVVSSIDEWNSYDSMAFDVRIVKDGQPVPLLRQLQELNGKEIPTTKEYEPGKTVSEVSSSKEESDEVLKDFFVNFQLNSGYFDETTGEIVAKEPVEPAEEDKTTADLFKYEDSGYVDLQDGKYIDSQGREWESKDAYEMYLLLSDPEYLNDVENSQVKK